jgi:threonine synthase
MPSSSASSVVTFFSHLECAVPCGAGPSDPRHLHHVCTCGAPLFARYDLTGAKKWPKSSLAGREASMWRYREILPLLEGDKGVDQPVTLGEGWTPLVRARRLGRALGLDRLFVKDESTNPSHSVKARAMSAAATRAVHLGSRAIALGSGGASVPAAAAYAARAALDARIYAPRGTRPVLLREAEIAGAEVAPVDGSLAEAARSATEAATAESWTDVSAFRSPYLVEGEKTIGYELAEQLGWQVPDWIVCAIGHGTTAVGLWKAFAEMAALGWIDPVRRPHLAAAQAAGCAPIVRAFAAGAEKAAAWEDPHTIAEGLRVAETAGDFLVLRALRESGGAALGVGDAEMLAGMKDFASFEGISASPESGAALHALRVLANEGRIKPHETVVVINAAGALRSLDVFAAGG